MTRISREAIVPRRVLRSTPGQPLNLWSREAVEVTSRRIAVRLGTPVSPLRAAAGSGTTAPRAYPGGGHVVAIRAPFVGRHHRRAGGVAPLPAPSFRPLSAPAPKGRKDPRSGRVGGVRTGRYRHVRGVRGRVRRFGERPRSGPHRPHLPRGEVGRRVAYVAAPTPRLAHFAPPPPPAAAPAPCPGPGHRRRVRPRRRTFAGSGAKSGVGRARCGGLGRLVGVLLARARHGRCRVRGGRDKGRDSRDDGRGRGTGGRGVVPVPVPLGVPRQNRGGQPFQAGRPAAIPGAVPFVPVPSHRPGAGAWDGGTPRGRISHGAPPGPPPAPAPWPASATPCFCRCPAPPRSRARSCRPRSSP